MNQFRPQTTAPPKPTSIPAAPGIVELSNTLLGMLQMIADLKVKFLVLSELLTKTGIVDEQSLAKALIEANNDPEVARLLSTSFNEALKTQKKEI